MIKLDGISMRFNLGLEPNYSIKEAFISIFDKKRRPKKTDFWALQDVSFEVKKGEVIGLIGSIIGYRLGMEIERSQLIQKTFFENT